MAQAPAAYCAGWTSAAAVLVRCHPVVRCYPGRAGAFARMDIHCTQSAACFGLQCEHAPPPPRFLPETHCSRIPTCTVAFQAARASRYDSTVRNRRRSQNHFGQWQTGQPHPNGQSDISCVATAPMLRQLSGIALHNRPPMYQAEKQAPAPAPCSGALRDKMPPRGTGPPIGIELV